MKTIIRKSILLLCVLCISNCIDAQIAVENSTPEKITKDILVYYTDGNSNLDYDRLWKYHRDENMQLDYCKAFIGQKILCLNPGDLIYPTYQIMDVEDGELILQLRLNNGKGAIEDFPVHKIATNCIRPKISKTKDGNDELLKWTDHFVDKKGKPFGRIRDLGGNTLSWYASNRITLDDRRRFFSQFLLIKGAYTIVEANRMVQESGEKLLSGKVYLPKVQKQIDKLEKKKQKGKIKPDELKMYHKLIVSDKYYKILRNGEEYYSTQNNLKGDTLILGQTNLGAICYSSFTNSYNNVALLVEDNKGQEYFISFFPGSGCITEKHLNHIKEQYVSQYVVKVYNNIPEGPIMKCEDIVLRDYDLQAKLRNIETGEISYVPFSYMGSSCDKYSSKYSQEENGAYFYLQNYEVIVPEGL